MQRTEIAYVRWRIIHNERDLPTEVRFATILVEMDFSSTLIAPDSFQVLARDGCSRAKCMQDVIAWQLTYRKIMCVNFITYSQLNAPPV